jgi:hypothetical protein
VCEVHGCALYSAVQDGEHSPAFPVDALTQPSNGCACLDVLARCPHTIPTSGRPFSAATGVHVRFVVEKVSLVQVYLSVHILIFPYRYYLTSAPYASTTLYHRTKKQQMGALKLRNAVSHVGETLDIKVLWHCFTFGSSLLIFPVFFSRNE